VSGDIGDLGDSVGGDGAGVVDMVEPANVIVLYGGLTSRLWSLERLLEIEIE
jgi:hypothetical protein